MPDNWRSQEPSDEVIISPGPRCCHEFGPSVECRQRTGYGSKCGHQPYFMIGNVPARFFRSAMATMTSSTTEVRVGDEPGTGTVTCSFGWVVEDGCAVPDGTWTGSITSDTEQLDEDHPEATGPGSGTGVSGAMDLEYSDFGGASCYFNLYGNTPIAHGFPDSTDFTISALGADGVGEPTWVFSAMDGDCEGYTTTPDPHTDDDDGSEPDYEWQQDATFTFGTLALCDEFTTAELLSTVLEDLTEGEWEDAEESSSCCAGADLSYDESFFDYSEFDLRVTWAPSCEGGTVRVSWTIIKTVDGGVGVETDYHEDVPETDGSFTVAIQPEMPATPGEVTTYCLKAGSAEVSFT